MGAGYNGAQRVSCALRVRILREKNMAVRVLLVLAIFVTEGRRRRRARADLRAGRRSRVATGQYPSKTRTKEMQYGQGRPQGEAGAVPGADRRVDGRDDHPMVEDTVVRGRATYEWLEGGRS